MAPAYSNFSLVHNNFMASNVMARHIGLNIDDICVEYCTRYHIYWLHASDYLSQNTLKIYFLFRDNYIPKIGLRSKLKFQLRKDSFIL